MQTSRLIFTFNENNPPLHKWIRDNQRLLFRNQRAKELGEKMQVTFKQPKNLKSLICGLDKQPQMDYNDDVGCSKCGRCHACDKVEKTKKFQSTNTKKVYSIREKINCDTPFVVYLGTCKKCHGQYVGKTVHPFKRRHSGHKQEVRHQYGGLGQHFGGPTGCGYANMSFILIEHTEIGNREKLAQRELFWQHQIRCFLENGKNGHCLRKEF